LVKRTKFTHFERWRTKLVKNFDEGLIPNFAQTGGTKNIFNPIKKNIYFAHHKCEPACGTKRAKKVHTFLNCGTKRAKKVHTGRAKTQDGPKWAWLAHFVIPSPIVFFFLRICLKLFLWTIVPFLGFFFYLIPLPVALN